MNRKLRMAGAIIGIAVCLLCSALSLAAQEEQAFRGVCVKAGPKYALSDPENKTIYNLDDQPRFETFADQPVVVIGSLDKTNGMIHVSDVMRALSPKVMKAVLVYVDCVDCPGAMAAAKKTSLQEVAGWKRFYLASDSHKADLIFLFSARPYLGDYLTRDRPPSGLIRVKAAYMNVLDPRTGESLWGDSREWGSWLVGSATKDLIDEFRAQVDAQEGRVAQLLSFDRDQNRKGFPNLGK